LFLSFAALDGLIYTTYGGYFVAINGTTGLPSWHMKVTQLGIQ
jgi:hypothetical protein